MIKTKRTICSPLRMDDFSDVLEMYKEKDSFKYIKPLLGKSPEFYLAFLQKKVKMNSVSVQFWVVRDQYTNLFIGTINLNKVHNTEYIQIGCHLKRAYWNKGIATELINALLVEAFENRKMAEVYGVFEESNQVSKKLLHNLGFSPFETKKLDEVNVHFHRLQNLNIKDE